MQASDIAESGGLDFDTTLLACAAMDGVYFNGNPMDTMQGRIDYWTTSLTERGRRAVGLWPSEKGGDALIELLRRAADQSTDEEERGLLKRAANALGGVSGSVVTEVLGAAARAGLGLS